MKERRLYTDSRNLSLIEEFGGWIYKTLFNKERNTAVGLSMVIGAVVGAVIMYRLLLGIGMICN